MSPTLFRVARENPQFARLWAAQIVSQSGDWLNRVAVLTLIGALGGKEHAAGIGALFGVELVLRLLPSALLGPLAGPVADRLPRRWLMVAADVGRALVVTGLFFVREPAHLPWIYALVALQMGISIFFDAARTGALPATVGPKDLHDAYTLSAATWSVVLCVGALVGGLLVHAMGAHAVFLVDAATYVASALCLIGLKLPPTPVHPERFRWRDVVMLTELRRGFAHARERGVAPVLFAKTFWGAAGGYLVLLALAGYEGFGQGAPGAAEHSAMAIGILYAARGVGTGLGPVLGRTFLGGGDRALKLQVSLGFFVAAAGYTAFGFCDRLGYAAFWVGVGHLGGATLWVSSTVLWQRHVADAYRGRVFALEFLTMDVSFAAGGALAGALFDATGSLATSVWVVSGLVFVLGLTWTWLARHVAKDGGDATTPPDETVAPLAGSAVVEEA